MPSRSKCINSSPPLRYSSMRYNLPPVWKAYIKSTINGCWKIMAQWINSGRCTRKGIYAYLWTQANKWVQEYKHQAIFSFWSRIDRSVYLDSFQNITFSFSMSGIFLISHDRRFLQHLHSKNHARIFASSFPNLKHFSVSSFTEDFAQFEILWPSFLLTRVDILFSEQHSFQIFRINAENPKFVTPCKTVHLRRYVLYIILFYEKTKNLLKVVHIWVWVISTLKKHNFCLVLEKPWFAYFFQFLRGFSLIMGFLSLWVFSQYYDKGKSYVDHSRWKKTIRKEHVLCKVLESEMRTFQNRCYMRGYEEWKWEKQG